MINTTSTDFATINIGDTKPTSIPMETIEVEILSEDLLGQFGQAFVKECYRVTPLRAQQVELTPEEVEDYCRYLLAQRIESIKGTCTNFHKLKCLYIPSWIQYNLSMIGIVTLRDIGLKLVPTMPRSNVITYQQAVAISEKIGMFEDDLQIVQDAMPRSVDGDPDVMSTALIAGYVRAIKPVQHVSSTYVTKFLGMKLKQEAAMKVLYRIQYDDAEFIASAFLTQRDLY